MIPAAFLSLVPFVLALFGGQPGLAGQSVSRLVVQDEVILRVPIQPRQMMPEIEWEERKAPKCLPTEMIRRAILSGDDRVDFILVGQVRVRAELSDDCPALDFYRGLYLQPQDDRLCAGRDEIHSRMGGSCKIHHFKHLVPKFR